MGQAHGADKMLLELGLDRCFDLLDSPHKSFDFLPRAARFSKAIRAPVPAALPGRPHMIQAAIRDHAQHHGVGRVDMAAERAGQRHPVHGRDAIPVHQQLHAGIERSLAQAGSRGRRSGRSGSAADRRHGRGAGRRRCGRRRRSAGCAPPSARRCRPSAVRIPARNISASTSMMPEPQIPVIPVFAVAAANPGSSDHISAPITLNRGSSVSRSMRTRSIAPGAARCPH